ncbi:MAG TPA: hypothetical protein VLF59_04605 [Candidatus Saccharimonadales bacterium]|nr:hypothetical protein [Candidatus Saccharimonadales bacterium]
MDEYNTAIEAYLERWRELQKNRTEASFFSSLRATAMAWKVTDLTEFNDRFMVLRDLSDQVHMGWINERWLATFHLKGLPLVDNIQVVKLMQRRPGSSDAVGLDHLDYLITAPEDAKAVLQAEPNLQWSEEKNGERCKWLSIWFAGTEAKLRRDTVLEICADELMDIDKVLKQAV